MDELCIAESSCRRRTALPNDSRLTSLEGDMVGGACVPAMLHQERVDGSRIDLGKLHPGPVLGRPTRARHFEHGPHNATVALERAFLSRQDHSHGVVRSHGLRGEDLGPAT